MTARTLWAYPTGMVDSPLSSTLQSSPTPPLHVTLTIEDVANLTGVRSPVTVRNWIKQGWLHTIDDDGMPRLDPNEVLSAKLLRNRDLLALSDLREARVTQADVS